MYLMTHVSDSKNRNILLYNMSVSNYIFLNFLQINCTIFLKKVYLFVFLICVLGRIRSIKLGL
jgi:hypothetical protein